MNLKSKILYILIGVFFVGSIYAQKLSVNDILGGISGSTTEDGIELSDEGLAQAATIIYTYQEGYLYEIVIQKDLLTIIHLSPYEEITNPNTVPIGEEKYFSLSVRNGVRDGLNHQMIILKPLVLNVTTNLIVTTNKRIYNLVVSSRGKSGMYNVEWRYPHEENTLSVGEEEEEEVSLDSFPLSSELLNFNYAIRSISGKKPVWMPTHVFDDGNFTFIRFPSSYELMHLPAVFSLNGKELHAVEWDISGEFYILNDLYNEIALIVNYNNKKLSRQNEAVRIIRTR